MSRQQLQDNMIANCVRLTGCTEEQARNELITEEWNQKDALINLRAWMKEKSNA